LTKMRVLCATLALLALFAVAQAVPLAKLGEIPVHTSPQEQAVTPVCTKCKETAAQIQESVKNLNATYALPLQQFMDDKICAQIQPPADADKCRTTVDEQLPEIWAAVIGNLAPEALCVSMHLCDAGAVLGGGPVDCKLCKQIAMAIDKQVFQNPKAIKEVEDELEKVCKELPTAAEQDKCQMDVAKALPGVMKQIGDLVAGELCTDGGFCTK